MPNNTATILEITGPEKDILRFIEQAASKTYSNHKLDFNNFVPMPEELKGTEAPTRIMTQEQIDTEIAAWKEKEESGQPCFSSLNIGITQEVYDKLIKDYGCSNWYGRTKKHWGTKWNSYENGDWNICNDEATLYYETAWSPATAFYLNMSPQFPELTFKQTYADEGGFYIGYNVIQNGKVIETLNAEWDSPTGIELQKRLGVYYEGDN